MGKVGDKVRIGNTYLEWHIKNATEPFSRFDQICLDLRDSRAETTTLKARIAELEKHLAFNIEARELK